MVILLIIEVKSNTKSSYVCSDDFSKVDIIIKTGDVLFAGTDANIAIIIRSNHGVMCQALNLDNYGNDRERNSTDEYVLCCPKDFLSDKNLLSMLGLFQYTRSGKHTPLFKDDWFIEHIQIRGDQRILLDYHLHSWAKATKKFLFGLTRINDTHFTRF